MTTRTWPILLAALSLLLGTAGCPTTDDDDSASGGDDDAGDDDGGDDDAGDDDASGTDADNDGYTDDVDCDDGDPDVNPGATEFCYDEVDNNCDGDVDEADADDCAPNDEEIDAEGDGASITVPPGAVMGDVTLEIAQVQPPRLPGDCVELTPYFAITPDGIVLAQPGEMSLPTNQQQAQARAVTLLWYDATIPDWVILYTPVTLDDLGNYLTQFAETGFYVIADCTIPD